MASHECAKSVAIQYEEEIKDASYSISETSSNNNHSLESPPVCSTNAERREFQRCDGGVNHHDVQNLIFMEAHDAAKSTHDRQANKSSYQSEFCPVVSLRPEPIRPQDSLGLSKESISWSTLYRTDYTVHSTSRLTPFKPRDNLIVGGDQINGTFFRHNEPLLELDDVTHKPA
ncbi:hypothetical protein FBUS_07408 [Fasciolopsis buskii]|uniref:Uncharacterized protein n=1 Tax=Fasciolopsis buskii TaxID=27845 RepID=A0A8E0RUN6_9TREM|nr:hypothetical protein FBUS_07408 [Fasciolopsis buski]